MADFIEGELVLCTVRDTVGTTVFVKINDTPYEGTITFSEIAPGRIRNIRDYVIPNKKIVCKVIKAEGNKLQLSFRRVKPNERKELLDRIEKEKSFKAILKTVLGEQESMTVIEKITEKHDLIDFFQNLEKNINELGTYISKENLDKIIKIFESKKEKPKVIRQIFKLSNKSSEGVNIVKNIMSESCKDRCEIKYLAAGKYSITLEGKDFKEINSKVNSTLQQIEFLAKKNHCDFSIEKK
ncbi:MAG: hypothetical protein Q8N99_06085 [Nanoarchaeota archaeon]|nr:hypothetical protein [Nanoarchaeota archaeon]